MSTKTILIPEIVEDFVFTYDSYGFLPYNRKATVMLQIGDVVEKVEFSTYNNGWNNNERVTAIRTNIEYVFREQLVKEDVDIEYDFLKDEYGIKRDKELKSDRIKRIKKYKEDYKEWWAHELKNIGIDGIGCEVMPEEDYVNIMLEGRYNPKAHIIYKDVKNEVLSNINRWNKKSNKRYTLRGSVTKNKKRIYGSLENLANKYITLVEFKLASDKAAEIAKENIRLAEEAKLKHLTDRFGKMVTKEERARTRWGSYSYRSQLMKNQYIQIKDKEYFITFITDENGNHLYEFEGIKDLNEKQVKGIIRSIKNN